MRSFASSTGLPSLTLLFGGLLVLSLGAGCQPDDPPTSYVARVGSHHLTEVDLNRRLASMGPIPDSTKARRQVIDQWVTRMLLYREAERRKLAAVEDVRRRLERQRRSTLIAALKDRFYRETDLTPSPQEIRSYFERHKNQLKLREPYVRARYLATSSQAAAQTVQESLRPQSLDADSTWIRLVREYAADTTQAFQFSRRPLPKGQVIAELPFSDDRLDALNEGDTSPIIEHKDRYHVLQLVRRIPAGTDPKLGWVEAEIRRRLRIRARKQMYTHEVQRLRNKAQADNALETP